MTETVLREIVQKAVRDGAFRAQLRTDPAKALAGFGLSAEERSAITSGDPVRLSALGVDQRMSKMFASGLLGDASKVVTGDPMISAGDSLTADETSGATTAIIGDPANPAASAAVEPSWGATHLRMIEQDLDTGGTPSVEVEGAGNQHLRMIEQDIDTGGSANRTFFTEDEELLASRSEASGATPSHLQMIEKDLDTGSALEGQTDISSAGQHLRSIEADLNTATNVDPEADVQITGNETPSDY
jgi:hypothetical protein